MKILELSALWFTLAIPVLILFYFFRWKRENKNWSTLLFWKQIIQEDRAESLWKKFQRNILFWIQLLLLLFLITSLLHPAIRGSKIITGDCIILIDNSASMQAPVPNSSKTRLDLAKEFAKDLIDRLPHQNRTTVILVNKNAEILLPPTYDKGVIKRTINNIPFTDSPTNLKDGINIAINLAGNIPSTKIYLLSDSATSLGKEYLLPEQINFIPFGTEIGNTAITGLAFPPETDPGGKYIRIIAVNFSQEEKEGSLEIRLNQNLIAVKPVKFSPGRHSIAIPRPQDDGVLELNLTTKDLFPKDNKVWATLTPFKTTFIKYHGRENKYLTDAIKSLGTYTLLNSLHGNNDINNAIHIFDGASTKTEVKNTLFIGGEPPPEIGKLKEWQDNAIITHPDPDHPLSRLLITETPVISKVAKIMPDDKAKPLLWSGSLPVAFTYESNEQKIVYLAFDINESNWHKYPGFLIFIDQALQFLNPNYNKPYIVTGDILTQNEYNKAGVFNNISVNMLNEEESNLSVTQLNSSKVITKQTAKKTAVTPGYKDLEPYITALILPLLFLEWLIYNFRRQK